MTSLLRYFVLGLLVPLGWTTASAQRVIPESLRPWRSWATWNDVHRDCPTPYSDPKTHRCFWPSRLSLQTRPTGAQFDVTVTVYGPSWMPLPGGDDAWPVTVRSNGVPVPVLEHEGRPAVHLTSGEVRLEGEFRWDNPPQRLRLPSEIGILSLTVDGQPVETPSWDAQGLLWLKRDGVSEEGEKDFLSVKVFAELEDGIPMWLRHQVELVVSGKSREETLGVILPAGWKLAAVQAPIPVLVDDAGRMRVQVRAGKWTLRADAFRLDDPKEFAFAAGTTPAVTEELVAFRARPDFRVLEIVGLPSVDVSQTAFPEVWRDLPVFRWETAAPFRMEERMRGMGDQKPSGLEIQREWWLDEGGRGLTFRDHISGVRQQIWRLDVAEGEALGSVRSGGQGQLITRNPQNGAAGVELRTRNLDLEATGRMDRVREFPATGWRADADALQVTLHLPPGWRLLALFGADWVRGDWLTAWSLLDLFLLLIFSLAVFRLWGLGAAALAFVAFGLSFHEPGAPRYLWLILLVPLALQHRVPEGWGRRLVLAAKWAALLAMVFILVPFVARQVQQALYPQLEMRGAYVSGESVGSPMATAKAPQIEESAADSPPTTRAYRMDPTLARRYGLIPAAPSAAARVESLTQNQNLLQDNSARIQTGPGVPEWTWRSAQFGWNGPVQSVQRVRPVLISMPAERCLTLLRVGLVLALAGLLLRSRRKAGGTPAAPAAVQAASLGVLLAAGLLLTPVPANAQAAPSAGGGGLFPDAATLELLRERLLAPSDAYPNAADIPSTSLTLAGRRLSMDVEVHAALRVAVPLPGRLPAWSPLTVRVDDQPGTALRRDDGFLWVVVPEGVHRVRVDGLLDALGDWEWTFLLKPRRVTIEAPDWTFTGIRADGVPDPQVFFTPKQRTAPDNADPATSPVSYDRQELNPMVAVDRQLELGLIWQVRTTVRRLSPPGKAVSLRLPLLPEENVLSANAIVRDGFIEVRLGAQDTEFQWEGGLTPTNRILLATKSADTWVEHWHLVASPVWNVTLSGLAPVFEADQPNLIPVWKPWPGESVSLEISRPEAIAGATVTVSRASHEVALGKRQHISRLELLLRCSLGEDFWVELPEGAEVTELTHAGRSIPVRLEGRRLVVPLRPGEQTLGIAWKVPAPLGFRAEAGEIQLPVDSANIHTQITVPDDRWILGATGPRRGPAVRFWGILICSLLAAVALGRLRNSPLRVWEWMLLVIGLTQVPLAAALTVIGWLFFLVARAHLAFQRLDSPRYNLLQVTLVLATAVALGVLLVAVGEGLLGSPEMFILGNGSTRTALLWYQDRSGPLLPRPVCYSISIWWFRFLMLLWALWLAAALIRWLQLGWRSFGSGGYWRPLRQPKPTPPPVVPAA